MEPFSKVELLDSTHVVSAFDCGSHESLSVWLRKYALQNQQNGSARTYVIHHNKSVVGYYAISAGSASKERSTRRVAHGLANHPVPVALLGRLAVDQSQQGKGLGASLLKDALVRIEHAADVMGIRAVMVNAIDDVARTFYERFGFEVCPNEEMHLMLLIKDLRKFLGK